MTDFVIYYVFSNVVCLVIFGIFLAHDLASVDRQEKQIKYDHALVAFMAYFISDSIWASVLAGVLPANRVSVVLCNLANYVIMFTVTHMWLRYVMAVEQAPNRNKRINKFIVLCPFCVSTVVLVSLYAFAPGTLLTEALEVRPVFNVFLIFVPCINIAVGMLYTMRRAKSEGNPLERRRHIYIGLFPLFVISGGLVQALLLPRTPIFCFCCAILMLTLYLQSMETQISLDPLTKLNNRAQLLRYVSQVGNLRIEGRQTYVMMLDVNRFKAINDTYGHAEGDRALTMVAASLKQAVTVCNLPAFLGRYGGDEFVVIVYPVTESELTALIGVIRDLIGAACKASGCPYLLTVGVGYDKLIEGQDTFQKCMQRADTKLYLDKEYSKLSAGEGESATGA